MFAEHVPLPQIIEAGADVDVGDEAVAPPQHAPQSGRAPAPIGVDIVTISQWLGQARVTTTNRYATVDLEMNRKGIEQHDRIDEIASGIALWSSDASILTWLEAVWQRAAHPGLARFQSVAVLELVVRTIAVGTLSAKRCDTSTDCYRPSEA